MRRFVLLSLTISLFFGVPVSAAQESLTGAAVILDTDNDGIPDELDACPLDPGQPSEDAKKSGCTPRALAKQWILAFLTRYSPPGHKTYFKFAEETKEEALVRYNEIADDLISTVYDPSVKPLFSGPMGRQQTASILLGVMFWETSIRKDVDLGLGPHARGDNGRSWCLMQINIGDGKTPGGLSGEDLVRDRKACLAEGLRVIRGSFGACWQLPLNERLAAYASGSCDKGREKSKQRVGTGMRWFNNSKSLRPFSDDEVLAGEFPKPIVPDVKTMLARAE